MPKYSFETIEQMLLKCVLEGGEPELGFRLRGEEYMIIAYADRCSFQNARTNPAQTREASGISPHCKSSTPRRR
nr:hypothetical protein [uncultured Campylobacter sp.]